MVSKKTVKWGSIALAMYVSFCSLKDTVAYNIPLIPLSNHFDEVVGNYINSSPNGYLETNYDGKLETIASVKNKYGEDNNLSMPEWKVTGGWTWPIKFSINPTMPEIDDSAIKAYLENPVNTAYKK